MTKKNKGGRPTVFTPETLQKLEQAFVAGCTDMEAALLANICAASFYSYQAANPEFLERKELLKNQPVLDARLCLTNSIKTDPDLALKYLERKVKGEFSTRGEVTGADGGAIETKQSIVFNPVGVTHEPSSE